MAYKAGSNVKEIKGGFFIIYRLRSLSPPVGVTHRLIPENPAKITVFSCSCAGLPYSKSGY